MIDKIFNFKLFGYLAFTVLLVSSPCKVRNFIQSQLGIEQTEVSSKSQSQLHYSVCDSWVENAVSATTLNFQKTSFSSPVAVLQTLNFTPFSFSTGISIPKISDIQGSVNVPYYILYQNFKAHLV